MKILALASLVNFLGTSTKNWIVEQTSLPTSTSVARQPAHHILCVDRSGSMYGDIPDVKSTLEKLLTLEEARSSALVVSVISYSSSGDVITHAARVPIADFMAARSPHLQAVRSIQATGLTCISQSLVVAKGLIRAGEITCVTLHSDGYANDPSPGRELQALRAAVTELRSYPRVFVNTVAYRSYSDFQTLSSLAALGGGQCFSAPTAKELAKALGETQSTLAGSLTPTVEIGVQGTQRALVTLSDGRVLLGKEGETVRIDGLPAGATGTVYRFNEPQTVGIGMGAMPPTFSGPDFFVALARASLAEGRIDVCKYAMVSSRLVALRDPTLLRALSGPDLVVLAAALQAVDLTRPTTNDVGLQSDQPSFLQLATFVGKYRDALAVDGLALVKGYKRIGVKSLEGSRDKKTGAVTPPRASVKKRDESGWWDVAGLDMNVNNANLNLLTVQPVDLVSPEGKVIPEVAGVKLTNLKTYRNYTLVADGQVSVPTLRIRASTAPARKALAKFGTVDAEGIAEIPLASMPVVPYDLTIPRPARNDYRTYLQLLAVRKIITALEQAAPKVGTGTYTPDQIVALREHHITPALYFSPPTTVPYTDRKAALNEGSLDTRISYRVDVGDSTILAAGHLPSANDYLDRRFEVTVDGKEAKATFANLTSKTAKVTEKKLTTRTKLNAVDDLLFPLYEHLLGVAETRDDPWDKLSSDAGFGATMTKLIQNFWSVGEAPNDAKLTKVAEALDTHIERFRETYLQPLALYTGSSGILPEGFDATMANAEAVSKKYPSLKIDKDQQDGSFFEQPDGLVVSVYPEESDFSTTKPA